MDALPYPNAPALSTADLMSFFRQHPDQWFSHDAIERELGTEVPNAVLFRLSVISKKLQAQKANDGSYLYRLDFRQVPLPAEVDWDLLLDEMDVLAFVIFKEIYRCDSLAASELYRILKHGTDYSTRTILHRIHWLADRGLVRIVLSKPLLVNARHEFAENARTFIEFYKLRKRLV